MIICYYSDYQNVKNMADAKFIDMKKFCGEIEEGNSVVMEIEHAAIRKLYETKGIKVEVVGRAINQNDNDSQSEQIATEIENSTKLTKPKRGGRK